MYTERKMVIVTFVSWAKIFSDSIHMEVYPAYCIHLCFLHLGQGGIILPGLAITKAFKDSTYKYIICKLFVKNNLA